MGVVLDTSVLIDAERKLLTVADFLRNLRVRFSPEELALATLSIAELEHGIWRATDTAREQRRREFLEEAGTATPRVSDRPLCDCGRG